MDNAEDCDAFFNNWRGERTGNVVHIFLYSFGNLRKHLSSHSRHRRRSDNNVLYSLFNSNLFALAPSASEFVCVVLFLRVCKSPKDHPLVYTASFVSLVPHSARRHNFKHTNFRMPRTLSEMCSSEPKRLAGGAVRTESAPTLSATPIEFANTARQYSHARLPTRKRIRPTFLSILCFFLFILPAGKHLYRFVSSAHHRNIRSKCNFNDDGLSSPP